MVDSLGGTPHTYYVVPADGHGYELRQTRFKDLFAVGHDHPHDVCAVSTTLDQMREMVKLLEGTVDWSKFE